MGRDRAGHTVRAEDSVRRGLATIGEAKGLPWLRIPVDRDHRFRSIVIAQSS
jgi:hypothetical protein